MIHDETPAAGRPADPPDNSDENNERKEEETRPARIEQPDPLYSAVLFLLKQAKTHNRDIGLEADRHTRSIAEYFGMTPEPAPAHHHEPDDPHAIALQQSRRFKNRGR